jgi:hypothetical protein
MPTSTKPIAKLTLAAALAVGASGCDWIWPQGSNPPQGAAKDANQLAALAAPAAPVAPAAAAPADAPARMTLAQQADFEAWMIRTYLGCWRPAPQPADSDPYVAQVRLAFRPDGSLSKPPKLVNPPSDPALKPQAKSVMLAVQNCNPLPVPAQYRPFYEQWKTKTIHFNPQLAAR